MGPDDGDVAPITAVSPRTAALDRPTVSSRALRAGCLRLPLFFFFAAAVRRCSVIVTPVVVVSVSRRGRRGGLGRFRLVLVGVLGLVVAGVVALVLVLVGAARSLCGVGAMGASGAGDGRFTRGGPCGETESTWCGGHGGVLRFDTA